MFEISEYQTADGKIPFREWLANLNDVMASARIDARLLRLLGGLFGDCKPIDQGVWDLRVDHGPGYRVYYGRDGNTLIARLSVPLLLSAEPQSFKPDLTVTLARDALTEHLECREPSGGLVLEPVTWKVGGVVLPGWQQSYLPNFFLTPGRSYAC